MNLSRNSVLFCDGELATSNYGDTTLRLNCFGYGGSNSAGCGVARTHLSDMLIPSNGLEDNCQLVLGLGPTPSTILKLGLSGGTEEVASIFEASVSTECNPNKPHHSNQASVDGNRLVVPVVDEGSTSAKKSGGFMPSLLLAPRMDSSKVTFLTQELSEPETKSYLDPSQVSSEPSAVSDYSISTISESATVGISSGHRTSNSKKCKFDGCSKGARGATGLCIGHGGGQRCQRYGCTKGAESRTAYCKAHGGGKRCQHLPCTKSAEGRTDYCIAHGGGRRCGHPSGCTKAARGKSGLCIRHGGGKRCRVNGCTRSAEGHVGLCISHGGGRRCQHPDCTKGAQGSTLYCKAHGGGKRCIVKNCTKGAEGSTPLCKGHGGGKRCLFDGGGICPKSVHGGTNFCVAHGGGKRCIVPECSKSARGRTDCCVRHGGGKRCKFDSCGKSAQGSTDFCKAHGGGKRCNWGNGKCEKFARGKSGLCAAHTTQEANKGGMIGPSLFHGIVSPCSTIASSFGNNYSSSGLSIPSDSVDSREKPAKRQHLMPPQVLIPLSMKSSSAYSRQLSSEKQGEGRTLGGNEGSIPGAADGSRKSFEFVITEGRVHGGGLMSLFGGNLKNAIDKI